MQRFGALFHVTNHPSTRVGRDRLRQLCDGRFHVFKVLWTVPVNLVPEPTSDPSDWQCFIDKMSVRICSMGVLGLNVILNIRLI